jgi:hypothetical protein
VNIASPFTFLIDNNSTVLVSADGSRWYLTTANALATIGGPVTINNSNAAAPTLTVNGATGATTATSIFNGVGSQYAIVATPGADNAAIQIAAGSTFRAGVDLAQGANPVFSIYEDSGGACHLVGRANALMDLWTNGTARISIAANGQATVNQPTGGGIPAVTLPGNLNGNVLGFGISNGNAGAFATAQWSMQVSDTITCELMSTASAALVGGDLTGSRLLLYSSSTSPIIIAPNFAASAIFNSNGTAAIKGTPTNDSAVAGWVGEYQPNNNNGAPVSLTNNTAATVTSLTLTAGDWDVDLLIYFGTTGTSSSAISGLSTTTNVLGASGTYGQQSWVPGALAAAIAVNCPTTRFSFNTSVPVYAIAYGSFTSGTMTATGFIRARRVR